MTQEQTKQLLCKKHRNLLYIILHFGNGAMLLPQLRAFCLALGLYANGQAVNCAVRELREAAILARQTWIDNNSDLILCRKYAYCFFSGKTREEVATPRRPNTMAPYILQARKVDWLLSTKEANDLFRALCRSRNYGAEGHGLGGRYPFMGCLPVAVLPYGSVRVCAGREPCGNIEIRLDSGCPRHVADPLLSLPAGRSKAGWACSVRCHR